MQPRDNQQNGDSLSKFRVTRAAVSSANPSATATADSEVRLAPVSMNYINRNEPALVGRLLSLVLQDNYLS